LQLPKARFAQAALMLTTASVLHGSDGTPQARIDSHVLCELSGRFEFKLDAAPVPLAIWYCRPSTVGPDTRVIFVMHGGNPETASQACDIGGE
jgi:poly(3-hydroxybutyrate) depolymerase